MGDVVLFAVERSFFSANAQRVLEKLAELDPHDEIGGAAYLQIARAFDEEA